MQPKFYCGVFLTEAATCNRKINTVHFDLNCRLSGRVPFQDKDPKLTETKIHDSTKLYPKVSQSASTFLKKILNGYPW